MSTETTVTQGCSVALRHVSLSYGDDTILREIDLSIEPGEIVSIIGRSGVGKSTLLRIAAGLLAPDAGEVLIEQRSAHEARMAKRIAFLPQRPALLPWRTVLANVSIPTEVNMRASVPASEPHEALKAVGLESSASAYPLQLSGGMQHRVAIPRSMVTGASLLLLDEPFASLDEVTRDSLYDTVLSWTDESRHTLVMVTHNVSEAVLLSDRVIVMSGRPARIAGQVVIGLDRPRQQALDAGDLELSIASVRSLLREQQ